MLDFAIYARFVDTLRDFRPRTERERLLQQALERMIETGLTAAEAAMGQDISQAQIKRFVQHVAHLGGLVDPEGKPLVTAQLLREFYLGAGRRPAQ